MGPYFLALAFLLLALTPARAPQALRFEVTVAPGLLPKPQDGRLLLVIAKRVGLEPRFTIGETGMNMPPVLGKDIVGMAPGVVALIDSTAQTFPISNI